MNIPFPDKKYNIIYADPPWMFSSGLRTSKKKEGKYLHYKPNTTVGKKYDTQSIDWIKKLPVNNISQENSILFFMDYRCTFKTSIRSN